MLIIATSTNIIEIPRTMTEGVLIDNVDTTLRSLGIIAAL